MKRRAVSLMLATAMLTSVFGGYCQADEEKVTIQLILPGNQEEFPEGLDEHNNFIVDKWREDTGYDFDITILPAENKSEIEETKIMFNSGEVEGIVISRHQSLVGQLADEGVIACLDDYVDDITLCQKYPEAQVTGQYEGSQYGIVTDPDAVFPSGGLVMANKGLMAEMGITEQPKTFEELNNLLYAFKDQGVLGAACFGSVVRKNFDLFHAMFGLSGSNSRFSLAEDGTLEFVWTTDRAKDFCTWMNQLYNDGIIPKDFSALDRQSGYELYLSGKAGMVVESGAWQVKSLFETSEELGIDTRYIDYPTDAYGNTAYGDTNGTVSTFSIYIGNNCPYMEEAINFLNYLVEPETVMLTNYGIEGEHYEMVDGEIVVKESFPWGVYYRNIFYPEDWYTVYGVNADWAEYYYPGERNTVGKEVYDLILNVDSTTKEKLTSLLDTLVAPWMVKFITGEESLDNWDAYVEEFLTSGGQEVIDEYNRVFETTAKEPYIVKSYMPENHPAYTGKYLFDGTL